MTTPQLVVTSEPLSSAQTAVTSQSALLGIALLTPAVFLLHGYHPFADDAGIYISGIRKLVNPELYQPDSAFVLAHTRFSLFAHLMAWTIRLTQLPLQALLLTAYLASIFLFLLACSMLARQLFASTVQRWFSVMFAAVCFTLPVAGTSLSLMDPYVTARSFSTPLGLFALAFAIDRRWARCVLLLLVCACIHPLMTIYAASFIALFFLIDFGIPRAAWIVCTQVIVACALIFLLRHHSPVSPAYREAILSRTYLFPSEWASYETLGLAMPLVLFTFGARRSTNSPVVRSICLAACLSGITATLIAVLFVSPGGSFLLTRIQPLRAFHILYALGVLLIGGLVGGIFFSPHRGLRSRWGAFALLSVVAAVFFVAQRASYPLSAHMELPGDAPRNPWQEAFLWIRANTPQDAVFAANPHLVFVEGEDSQGFRATAERSLLADDKDEGVVVVFPYLADEWARQRNPQAGIDIMTDAQRKAQLRPLGADWMLLSRSAVTTLPCPYRNSVAQVCRL